MFEAKFTDGLETISPDSHARYSSWDGSYLIVISHPANPSTGTFVILIGTDITSEVEASTVPMETTKSDVAKAVPKLIEVAKMVTNIVITIKMLKTFFI
ncbi:MAG: hypothetical protein BWY74_02461 [Firmicutes bacterium ADurb.Bin419]|nr:MAG: hypothetical protein BWY74_02461 [Firmicutes bacterium ADurb.Bin419]